MLQRVKAIASCRIYPLLLRKKKRRPAILLRIAKVNGTGLVFPGRRLQRGHGRLMARKQCNGTTQGPQRTVYVPRQLLT